MVKWSKRSNEEKIKMSEKTHPNPKPHWYIFGKEEIFIKRLLELLPFHTAVNNDPFITKVTLKWLHDELKNTQLNVNWHNNVSKTLTSEATWWLREKDPEFKRTHNIALAHYLGVASDLCDCERCSKLKEKMKVEKDEN